MICERDLVGQGVLDRRIVDQRLDVGYVAVGVGDLVGAPDAQHRQRGEHAADHDEHDGDRRPPAEPPSANHAIRLAAELGSLGLEAFDLRRLGGRLGAEALQLSRLGPEPFQLGSLVRTDHGILGRRPRATVGIRQGHLRRVRSAVPFQQPLVTSLGVIALPIHAVWPGPDPPHPARVSPGSSRKEQLRARYREIAQLRMPATSRGRAAGSCALLALAGDDDPGRQVGQDPGASGDDGDLDR